MPEKATKEKAWKKFLFSELMLQKNTTHKIAFLGVLVALNIVANAIGTISLGIVQYSMTLFVVALTGIIVGPLFGFGVCVLGDTLGYFIGNGGANGWTPWIGLSMGVAAVLSALIINGIPSKKKGWIYVKLLILCVATFLICTYAINTTAAYYLWNSKGLPYKEFVFARMSLQIWNNVINGVLLFVAVPYLSKIKILGIKL